MHHIQELEQALHQYEIRTDKQKITKLLHPAFIEIGYSGTTYGYRDIINSMLAEEKPDYQVWSQDYRFIELADSLVQVIYHEARMDKQGNLSRHAKRNSIWVKNGSNWQIKFHQGTPTKAFDKFKGKQA